MPCAEEDGFGKELHEEDDGSGELGHAEEEENRNEELALVAYYRG